MGWRGDGATKRRGDAMNVVRASQLSYLSLSPRLPFSPSLRLPLSRFSDCFDEAAHELEAFAARRCFNAAAHVNRVRADGLDGSRDVIRREAASEEESGHDLARAARERPVERVPRAAPSVRDEGVEQHGVRPVECRTLGAV